MTVDFYDKLCYCQTITLFTSMGVMHFNGFNGLNKSFSGELVRHE